MSTFLAASRSCIGGMFLLHMHISLGGHFRFGLNAVILVKLSDDRFAVLSGRWLPAISGFFSERLLS